jgi:hypothetical protein
MDSLLSIFGTFLFTTAQYLFSIFGVFFIFGFVLSELQEKTHRAYTDVFGWKGILFTAWIGTPIHELGHVFFAKLFGHKIDNVSLFSPNYETGGLGHVDHSFNPKNIYHRIGNFFIGTAPLLFGSCVLLILGVIFFPHSISTIPSLFETVDIHTYTTSILLFVQQSHLSHWQWALFLYISFCTVSHMAPSRQDQKNMWDGFFFLGTLIALYSGTTLILQTDGMQYIISFTTPVINLLVPLWTYTFFVCVIHYICTVIFLQPFIAYKKRRL